MGRGIIIVFFAYVKYNRSSDTERYCESNIERTTVRKAFEIR